METGPNFLNGGDEKGLTSHGGWRQILTSCVVDMKKVSLPVAGWRQATHFLCDGDEGRVLLPVIGWRQVLTSYVVEMKACSHFLCGGDEGRVSLPVTGSNFLYVV